MLEWHSQAIQMQTVIPVGLTVLTYYVALFPSATSAELFAMEHDMACDVSSESFVETSGPRVA